VQLDSVRINGTSVSAVLNVTRNKLFRIDSVVVIGTAKLRKGFLFRYLGVK
jgi:hypothetical protein